MEQQQKKRIKQYIAWALVVVLVIFLAFLPVIASNEQPETGPQASILSTTVQSRTISETISGGGKLFSDDVEEITIPVEVKVAEYLVSNGDMVTEGQPIATVDRVSVMSAITEVQDTLVEIRQDLNKIASKKESTKVNAQAGGTVKIIYGAAGENVQDVILRHGALAVISLDGRMAVQLYGNSNLVGGDSVRVTLSDGAQVEGRVESNLEGILTVTVEDDDFLVGDPVNVATVEGEQIGTGNLYIHNPWNVLAYSGTISRVRVSEGTTVSAGKRLFDLENTGHTAQYDALSRKHQKYEELMLELFKMYQSETVTAPQAGIVSGVDPDGVYMLASIQNEFKVTLLSNAPNGDDEAEYTNYVGQVTEVGTDGLILRINPQAISITDYKDLSAVPMDTALMTYQTPYWSSAPVYELSGEEWIQISDASIAAGDILLFTGSGGSFAWVIRIGSAAPPEPTEPPTAPPTEPPATEPPITPSTPSTPSGSGQITPPSNITPVIPSISVGRIPQIGAAGYAAGAGAAAAEEDDLYSLDTLSIAFVTAQDDITVQISIDELDISRIYPGQAATVTLDAINGEEFAGVVSNIANTGTSAGGNSKFTVDVTIPKTENMLPGMTAHVSIVLTAVEDILSIPVAALTETGEETVVYTGYDAEAEAFINPIPVKTGISDGKYVQILSGLSIGDTIYYPYYDTLVISNKAESKITFG